MKLSTTFHPQKNGQAERTIQTLKDMLRSCIIDFKGNWDRHFSLVEFCYYNNFHSSTSMAPYEVFYSMRCRPPIGWFEVGESSLLGPDFIYKTLEKVHITRNLLETPYSRHKYYVDHRVGPFEILQRVGKVAYELKLPSELASVHLVFHVTKLKKCIGDPSLFFLLRVLV